MDTHVTAERPDTPGPPVDQPDPSALPARVLRTPFGLSRTVMASEAHLSDDEQWARAKHKAKVAHVLDREVALGRGYRLGPPMCIETRANAAVDAWTGEWWSEVLSIPEI